MSKKKSDEKITESIKEIMKQNISKIVVTPDEEPKQKVYAAWGAKKPKK